jgi:uncharacterized SAM-binding protein YcdF (DUF218 family)
VTAALVVLALALAGGFLWYVGHVPADEVSLDRKADGIVVLTGGASRIADAIELLADGHGQRLLISGVNPTTRAVELQKQNPQYARMFNCCIDLDRTASNTIGNALETRRWARSRNFHSLVVVTSSYHMPRAMAELENQLPDVTLIPFPVVTEKLRAEPWWSNSASARLLATEYLKYLVARVRILLEPNADTAEKNNQQSAS